MSDEETVKNLKKLQKNQKILVGIIVVMLIGAYFVYQEYKDQQRLESYRRAAEDAERQHDALMRTFDKLDEIEENYRKSY